MIHDRVKTTGEAFTAWEFSLFSGSVSETKDLYVFR